MMKRISCKNFPDCTKIVRFRKAGTLVKYKGYCRSCFKAKFNFGRAK